MGFRTYLLSLIFEYETTKILIINSKRVSLINRFIQACILAYIIGYVLVYEKGYQSFDNVESAITSKVKGITVTNYSDDEFQVNTNKELYNRVWDAIEYVIPPSENGAFFIMTNVIITPNQTQSVCDETADLEAALCDPQAVKPCPVGVIFKLGNGQTTGKCVNSTQVPGKFVCEVKAWCPVEYDVLPLKNNRVLINGAENYTVLIKNSIDFPFFGSKYRRNNIVKTSNSSYLQSCYYNEITDPFCPVFRIGDMIREAGENFTEMAYKGAVMAITIKWYCDLDWSFMDYCVPSYSFRRLDDHAPLIAPGWNFRFSYNHEFGRRTTLKAYGIKFVLETQGRAGKFDLIPTFLNIGAGLGLMALASIISDLVVSGLANSRNQYKENKYEYIEGEDSFQINREGYQAVL